MKLFSSVVALLAMSVPASAAVVFANDYESGGGSRVESAQGYDGVNGISGNFLRFDDRGSYTVNIGSLADHDTLEVSFDLAFIDSWDGGAPNICCGGSIIGPDLFNVVLDGNSILQTSNFDPLDDALTDGQFGAFGFNPEFDDGAYRVSLSAAHTSSSFSISFFADGDGYQGGFDESWAIDNLRISTSGDGGVGVVPLSSSMTLMLSALGLGAVGLRRRRG